MKKFVLLALLLAGCTRADHDSVVRNRETAKDRYFESYYHTAQR